MISVSGETAMPTRHKVVSKEIGQLRIYMTPKEKRVSSSYRQKLFGKALYQEIIDAAKQNGILNATAHHTHYGYSGSGKVESGAMSEIPNLSLNLCVELSRPAKSWNCSYATMRTFSRAKSLCISIWSIGIPELWVVQVPSFHPVARFVGTCVLITHSI
jgi:PII-like signaling protein